jgi:hypothetical protein
MPKQVSAFVVDEPEIPSFKVDFSSLDPMQVVMSFCEEHDLKLKPGIVYEEVEDLNVFVKDLCRNTNIRKKYDLIESYGVILNFFREHFSMAYVKTPNSREKESPGSHIVKPDFIEKMVPACFRLADGSYKYFKIMIKESTIKGAGMGIFALEDIPKGAMAQYKGLAKSADAMNPFYSWEVHRYDIRGRSKVFSDPIHYLDATSIAHSNWPRFVNCGPSSASNNMDINQIYDKIFYLTTRRIKKGEELFIDYGEGYRTDNLHIEDDDY